MYCVRVSLRTVKLFFAQNQREEVVGNPYISLVVVQERAGLLAAAGKRPAAAPSVHSNYSLVEPPQVSR